MQKTTGSNPGNAIMSKSSLTGQQNSSFNINSQVVNWFVDSISPRKEDLLGDIAALACIPADFFLSQMCVPTCFSIVMARVKVHFLCILRTRSEFSIHCEKIGRAPELQKCRLEIREKKTKTYECLEEQGGLRPLKRQGIVMPSANVIEHLK